MVLAVIYGVYTVFFSAPREVSISSGHKELETLNSFVTKVAEQTKTGLSKEETYILQKARRSRACNTRAIVYAVTVKVNR